METSTMRLTWCSSLIKINIMYRVYSTIKRDGRLTKSHFSREHYNLKLIENSNFSLHLQLMFQQDASMSDKKIFCFKG